MSPLNFSGLLPAVSACWPPGLLAAQQPAGWAPATEPAIKLTLLLLQHWREAMEKTELAEQEVATATLHADKANAALGKAQQAQGVMGQHASEHDRVSPFLPCCALEAKHTCHGASTAPVLACSHSSAELEIAAAALYSPEHTLLFPAHQTFAVSSQLTCCVPCAAAG